MAGGAAPARDRPARPSGEAGNPGSQAGSAGYTDLGAGRRKPYRERPSQARGPLRGGLSERPACAACASLVRPQWRGRADPLARTRAHRAGRDRNINYFNTKRRNPACRLPSLRGRPEAARAPASDHRRRDEPRRRRSRRGSADRGMARAAGWHRASAGPRPQGHDPALYAQRPDFIRTLSRGRRAAAAALHQRLATLCSGDQIGKPRGPGDGPGRTAGRALPGPQRRPGAGPRRARRRLCRCGHIGRIPAA